MKKQTASDLAQEVQRLEHELDQIVLQGKANSAAAHRNLADARDALLQAQETERTAQAIDASRQRAADEKEAACLTTAALARIAAAVAAHPIPLESAK